MCDSCNGAKIAECADVEPSDMQRWTSGLTLGGLAVLSMVLLGVSDHLVSLDGGIHRLIRSRSQLMQEFVEVVSPLSDPSRQVTVRTVRLPDETLDAWRQRHEDAVQAIINS